MNYTHTHTSTYPTTPPARTHVPASPPRTRPPHAGAPPGKTPRPQTHAPSAHLPPPHHHSTQWPLLSLRPPTPGWPRGAECCCCCSPVVLAVVLAAAVGGCCPRRRPRGRRGLRRGSVCFCFGGDLGGLGWIERMIYIYYNLSYIYL